MSNTTSPPTSSTRLGYLDFLKGLAILFVLLVHSFAPADINSALGALHAGQAVPIFLLVAGITSQLSFEKSKYSLKAYYRKLPAKIIHLYSWYLIFILMFMMFQNNIISFEAMLAHIIYGPLGAGGYFVPLMAQHLILFPTIMLLKKKVDNTLRFILIIISLNILLEYICVVIEINPFVYRSLYIRYITVAALGAIFANWLQSSKKITLPLTAISTIYLIAVANFNFKIPIIPDLWTYHHYPAAFYTAGIAALAACYYSKFPFQKTICRFGRSSYTIYLTQMLFFTTVWNLTPLAQHSTIRLLLTFPLCIGIGVAIDWLTTFYKRTQSLP